MTAPDAIVALYEEAQINESMDSGTYVGGTTQYGVPSILEEVAKLVGWVLPAKLTLEQMEAELTEQGRADEIEYLGC